MKKHFVIVLIILLSIVVRFYGITSEPYWVDEALSIQYSLLPLSTNIVHSVFDVHPPLYTITLWFWVRIFGDSEFSTRFLSMIFGVLTVYAIYHLGKLFDNKTALIASLITALSSFHIYYAQETRMYTLLTLLFTLSFLFFIKVFLKNSNNKFHILFSVLLVYTHLFGWFALFLQGLYIYFVQRKDFKKFLRNFRIIFAFYIPWIPATIIQFLKVQDFFWIDKPNLANLLETFKLFAGSMYLLILYMVISLVIVFLLTKKESRKIFSTHKKEITLLFMWLFIPIITIFLYSQIFRPLFMPRYFLFSSLAFYLLISLALKYLKYLSYPLIIIIILLSFQGIQYNYEVTFKQNWNQVAMFMYFHLHDDHILIIQPHYEQHAFWYYYNKECLIDAHWKTQCSLEPNIYPLDILPEDKEFMQGKVVWFARNDLSLIDQEQVFLNWLKENRFESGYWHFHYVDLYRFE